MSDLRYFRCNGRKILGVAWNYMEVVRKKPITVPKTPVMFLKPTTSYLSEGRHIILPQVFNKVIYEVELGVIIGQLCKNVSKDCALKYVGGYCLALDLTAQCNLTTARAAGQPWSLGKGFDTSTPVGRLIPVREVDDPHSLLIWLKLNGELKQKGCTADMIFKIPEIISYTSQHMTLEPNDLILTGNCGGAGQFKAGDVIECGLDDFYKMTFYVSAET